MDIKLKNKYDIRYLVIGGCILLSALIMLGLYPYFEKKAEAGNTEYYQYADTEFLRILSNSNYVLYREMQNLETDRQRSPVELFLPNLLDERSSVSSEADLGETVKTLFLETYKTWEDSWNQYRKNIDYQVYDQKREKLVLGNQEEEMSPADYTVFIRVDYDENGNPMISQANGVGESRQIRNILQEFLYENPLDSFYGDDMRYDYRYALANPTGCTFVYGLTQEQVDTFLEEHTDISYAGNYLYYTSGDVMKMVVTLAFFLFLLAFLIPIADKRVNGKEWYSRGFLEAALLVGGLMLSPIHVNMVANVNQGIWKQNLEAAGFMPIVARLLVYVGGLVWWLVVFSVIFWASSCVLSVRTLGVRVYLKERCLTLRGSRYLVSAFRWAVSRIYGMIIRVDRNEESRRTVFKLVLINFLILAAIVSSWFFNFTLLVIYSIVLFVILSKYFKDRKYQYKILLKATNAIAQGNLDVEIKEDLGMFEPFKKEIQKIQQGFKKAVDEEVKSQRMKTDLISNVSHDLKTPLTAIITYVNLLKEDSVTPEQRKDYIEVLDSKSMRLKALIEDIFEISKATSQNVTLNLVEMDIVNLMKQVRLELDDKIEESQLDFRWRLPEHKIVLMLDSQKTFRIFENLLLNILKYSLSGTRVFIDMGIQGDEVVISMKNISAVELEGDPNDMTERFARGDQARNTEGSGLGLAIVKSFVELQKGKLELETEADLFKVTIRWKAVEL